jgi:hypothetical protein
MSGEKVAQICVKLDREEARRLESLVRTSGLGTKSAVVQMLIREADVILPARFGRRTTEDRTPYSVR